MHSSTSSFDYPLAALPWFKLLGGALLALAAVVGWLEVELASRGYRPTVLDSKERWISERQRASNLGEDALILIGASRIQLGADLAILRKKTEREPVQLGIDGSSFVAVLAGLAADDRIRGTILIDFEPAIVAGAHHTPSGISRSYQDAFAGSEARSSRISLSSAEAYLTASIHENLRSYADGSNPFYSLNARVFSEDHTQQYLITQPDRSRLADYQLVKMPSFYYTRVAQYLGMSLPAHATDQHKALLLRGELDELAPLENSGFLKGIETIKTMVERIRSRGGRVLFVEMPTSGMVKELNARKYPPAQFMDVFVAHIGVPTLTAQMIGAQGSFTCPDGSHLDFRDRERLSHIVGNFVKQNL